MPTEAAAITRVGLEHEYRVRRGEAPVDFRGLIHELRFDGVRADPVDPNAYRMPWGGVVTCDGAEAEIAIPSVGIGAGFTGEVATLGRIGRAAIEARLPRSLGLHGYSTHISVSMPPRRDVRAARRYASTFGPALMLLMDRAESPGLLVRPRPGRLELCGEHTAGAQLVGAVAYAAASVLALRDPDRHARRALDRLRIDVAIAPATQRFGWYVDRRAFGEDLYASGRGTRLRAGGGFVTAQQHLEATWEHARAALAPHVAASDLGAVDALVDGRLPLPLELAADDALADLGDGSEPLADHACDLRERDRGAYRVRTALVTWDFAVFGVRRGDHEIFVSMPAPQVGTFLDEVDSGWADDLLIDALDRPPTIRLEREHQTRTPGIYAAVGNADALLPSERDAATGRRIGAGGGGARPRPRPGKRDDARAPRPARSARPLLAVGAGIAAIVIAVGVAFAVFAGGGSSAHRATGRAGRAASPPTGSTAARPALVGTSTLAYGAPVRTASVPNPPASTSTVPPPPALRIQCSRTECGLLIGDTLVPSQGGRFDVTTRFPIPSRSAECATEITYTWALATSGRVLRDGLAFPGRLTGTITVDMPGGTFFGDGVTTALQTDCFGVTDTYTVDAVPAA